MAAKESANNNPGLATSIDEATQGYFLQQTMLRVKDPKVSLDFYTRIMGMSLLKRLDLSDMKFTLYFLGHVDTSPAPADPVERTAWTFAQRATLELTHNWGTETDPEFKGHHNGNSEPLGFGLILGAVSVLWSFNFCIISNLYDYQTKTRFNDYNLVHHDDPHDRI